MEHEEQKGHARLRAYGPDALGICPRDLLVPVHCVSFSERRLSLLRVEVYEALATATGEIRVWLRL